MATELQINDGWYEFDVLPRVNDLVVKASRAIRDDAKAICPVDTGALRDSIIAYSVRIGVARIGSHLDYCAAVELGFDGLEYVRAHERDGHPVRSSVRRGRTPEQPFLRPAAYRQRDLSEL